ncbi:hypothetical protein D9613_006562 [Agrocybe pediades]|uniref:Uncharacterized protein n=1 Tax=Agrocybe pediades TaxID=84607 RepID=A0A8H4QH04_9AGAR|nr:hypothetical protein D9613_006562 [Agrocybe pediades]
MSLLSSGSNAQGQLGNGSLEDAHTFQPCSFLDQAEHRLPSGALEVLDVATGANHTLVLLRMQDHSTELWGCGDGRKGQLGLRYQQEIQSGENSGLFRKIRLQLKDSGIEGYQYKLIASTWETSFVALSREGSSDVLLSFGSDDYGDLGIGGLKKGAPPKDHYRVQLIQEENVMIDAVFTGQRQIIAKVHTPSSSYLLGWGASRHGQLGEQSNIPFLSQPRVISTQNILSCSLGIQHTILMHTSSHLSPLGSNRKGQLEVAQKWTKNNGAIKAIGCTWNGSYIISENSGFWEIHSSGSNAHSQLGWRSKSDSDQTICGVVQFSQSLPTSDTNIELICGSEHILVFLSPSSCATEVWGWGWNEHGNLGLGHTKDVATPTKIWPQFAEGNSGSAAKIWAGMGTSWIFLKEET